MRFPSTNTNTIHQRANHTITPRKTRTHSASNARLPSQHHYISSLSIGFAMQRLLLLLVAASVIRWCGAALSPSAMDAPAMALHEPSQQEDLEHFVMHFLHQHQQLNCVDGASHADCGKPHADMVPVNGHSSTGNDCAVGAPAASDACAGDVPDAQRHIRFEPKILDFLEQPMGKTSTVQVTVSNRHPKRSVFIGPVSGVLPDFFSTFFDDTVKVIQPLGNITFNVVFLPRQIGRLHSTLYMQTSFGVRSFAMRGIGAECVFRLQPIVGIRASLNATLMPEIMMYNPYGVPLQILEVYSSGGEFKLELPSGGPEASRDMWEIPPYSERPVVRVSFRAQTPGNHTAYIRIMVVGESSEVDDMELVVPMQIEVADTHGPYTERAFLNFGRGGRHDKPKRLHFNLVDSEASARQMPSVQSYAVEGDADLIEAITLRLDPPPQQHTVAEPVFETLALSSPIDDAHPFLKAAHVDQPAALPSSSPADQASITMSATLNWSKLSLYKIYRGHIAIRTLLSNNQEANLRIALVAEALIGSLFYNDSHTQFVTASAQQSSTTSAESTREFVVRNDFQVPLAITNISLSPSIANEFRVSDFSPRLLRASDEAVVARITTQTAPALARPTSGHMLLHTNASTYAIMLARYDGLLRRIVPVDERTAGGTGADERSINYGTLPLSTVTDTMVAFVNDNPVAVTIHNWTATISDAASIFVLLRGCGQLTMDGLKFCYSVPPGEWIVFQVSVLSNAVGTFVGQLSLKTDYEELMTPVRFSTAIGHLHITATDRSSCSPGSVCRLNVAALSTFVQPIIVNEISLNISGKTYDYTGSTRQTIVPNELTQIARMKLHTRRICGDECQLQFPDRWMPSAIAQHTGDNTLLKAKLADFYQMRTGFKHLMLCIRTNQVRRYDFNTSLRLVWPKLITNYGQTGQRTDDDEPATGAIEFPTMQVGEDVQHSVTLANPSDQPIVVYLQLHDYSRPVTTLSFAPEVLTNCWGCGLSRESVFSFVDESAGDLRTIPPHGQLSVALRFRSQNAGTFWNLLYVRNNYTILEVAWLQARAAAYQFKFGNRKPGSSTPLVFELTDKQFRKCDRTHNRDAPDGKATSLWPDDGSDADDDMTIVTKRTFTAKNTGDIAIDVYGMSIEGYPCGAYGFSVSNCLQFRLPPDSSKKIDITFSPDFTLARVSRLLSIETSLNYPINYTLLSLVPANALNACSKQVRRPSWENRFQFVTFLLLLLMLVMVVCLSFFDADRVLNNASNASRDRGTAEPPLNLRNVGLRSNDGRVTSETLSGEVLADGSANRPNGGGAPAKAKLPPTTFVRKRNPGAGRRSDGAEQPAPVPSAQISTKSWSDVLARKFSPIKSDVKFVETSTPGADAQPRVSDYRKAAEISGKRNVVALMDANLPAQSSQVSRSSATSSTKDESASPPPSTNEAPSISKKYGNTAGCAFANKKNQHQAPVDSLAAFLPAATSTAPPASSGSSTSANAAVAKSEAANAVGSKSKAKVAVKKTKSVPLTTSATTVPKPANSTAAPIVTPKTAKTSPWTELTIQKYAVKAPVASSVAPKVPIEKRSSTSASSACLPPSSLNTPTAPVTPVTPNVGVTSLPNGQRDKRSPTAASSEPKEPEKICKKHGKTPGRERRSADLTIKTGARKLNMLANFDSVVDVDSKNTYKNTAFQFSSPLAPVEPAQNAWPSNKISFSNIVAQNATPSVAATEPDIVLATSEQTPVAVQPEEPVAEKQAAVEPIVNAGQIIATKPIVEHTNVDPEPAHAEEPPIKGAAVVEQYIDNAQRTSTTFNRIQNMQPQRDIKNLIDPVNDDSFLADELLGGIDLGPIGTRKSPAQTPAVWEPMQPMIYKPLSGPLDVEPTSNIDNPNSFFSSNFPKYNSSDFDHNMHNSNDNLVNLRRYSRIFSDNAIGLGSDLLEPTLWNQPLVLDMMSDQRNNSSMDNTNGSNGMERQPNAMLNNSIAQPMDNYSMTNGHQMTLFHQQRQQQQQLHQQQIHQQQLQQQSMPYFSNVSMPSAHHQQQLLSAASPNTGNAQPASYCDPHQQLWNSNSFDTFTVNPLNIEPDSWRMARPMPPCPIRPPPGLERQSFQHRLFNQQQHNIHQQQLNNNINHAANAMLSSATIGSEIDSSSGVACALPPKGVNNAFSAYNSLGSIWTSSRESGVWSTASNGSPPKLNSPTSSTQSSQPLNGSTSSINHNGKHRSIH